MNENPVKIHNKFSAEEIELLKKKAKKINFLRPFFGEAFDSLVDETTIEESFKVGVSTKFNLNENVVLDETFLNKLSAVTQLNDSSSIGDSSEQPTSSIIVQLLNTITTEELFKQFKGLKINLDDSINFSEAFNLEEISVLLDAISVNDDLINTASFKNQFLSSVGFSELLTIIVNSDIQQETSDSILIGDDFLQKVDILFNLSDSTSVSDSISVKSEIPISLDDTITIEDNLSIDNAITLNLTDSVTLEDLISNFINFKSLFTEAVLITDDFISTTNFVTNLSSSTNVTDDSNAFDSYTTYYVNGIFVDDVLTSFLILGVRNTTLVSPVNTNTSGNVLFVWNTAENATGYDLQVGTNSNFLTGLVINLTNLSTTSYTAQSPLANNTYFWRVRGRNNTTGKIGNWTPAATFNVISLAAPVFTYPLNNQNTSLSVTASWNSISLADSYDLQLSNASNFSNILLNVNTSDTSYVLPTLTKDLTYYLRIRSRSGSLFSDWSTITFTTLIAALNDATTSLDEFKHISIMKNNMFETTTITDSLFSEVISGFVEAPTLISPTASAQTGSDVLFRWSEVSNVDSYEFFLSSDAGFGTIIKTAQTVNPEIIVSELNNNATYYWRVRAKKNGFDSALTASRQFTVISTFEYTVYPYQLLSDVPTTKTFINWIDNSATVSTANSTLYYGPDLDNLTTVSVASNGVLSNTLKRTFNNHITGLTANTPYKCFIKTGNNNYSKVFTFKTEPTTLTSDYKVAMLSDIHIEDTDPESMATSTEMSLVRSENPNILCLIGDIVSRSDVKDEAKSNEYIRFFKEHINTYLYTNNVMIPMVVVPGNHDVGELASENAATTPKSADTGYFQQLFNTFKVTNTNQNHGYITIGTDLKIIAMDLFSSTLQTQVNHIQNAGTSEKYIIPISHFPILPSTTRAVQDGNYFPTVIRTLSPIVSNNNKIKAYFTGHMHTQYNSKRWSVTESETIPPTNLVSLGSNKYIVSDTSVTGKTEFGSGYKGARQLLSATYDGIYIGYNASYVGKVYSGSQSDVPTGTLVPSTFYIVTLNAATGNEKFKVEQLVYNSSNNIIAERNEFDMLLEEPQIPEETEPITGTTYLAMDWDQTEGVWE
jgi:predicted phosphodiesterase